MKQRNQSIDAIKGFAIVLVMLGHVFVHNHMEDPYVYDFIKAVQMPLFMIISGYLCGHGRKITNLQDYTGRLKKRAFSYLVPFFSWLTLMHLTDLRYAYKTIFFQLDYGLWFLMVLFLLTFMTLTAQLIAGKLAKKEGIKKELLFWIIYGIMCLIPAGQLLTGNQFLSPYLTILYIPFYALGYAAGAYGSYFLCWDKGESGKINAKNSKVICSIAIVSFLAFLYLVATRNLNSMETRKDTLIQMTASMLGSISIIYGICRLKEGKLKRLLAKLGNATLEIYVIHYHFANLLNFQKKQYEFYSLEGILFVIASFVTMSAVTFCSIWIMKKVKLADFLFFGKKAASR